MRTALAAGLTLASALLLAALVLGGPGATPVVAVLALLFPCALIGLAASRSPRRRALYGALTGLSLSLTLVASALLRLAGTDATTPRPFGLPAATWWMLLGLGLGPLVVVVATHAWTERPHRVRPAGGSSR